MVFITINLIKKLLENEGRFELLPYISSEEKFCMLKINRPDIFNKLYTRGFIEEMKRSNPTLFKKWYECTIGLSDPVFLVRLKYSGTSNIRLTKIVYNVTSISQILGEESFLDIPIATYEHFLDYKTGIQEKELEPPIIIEGDENGTFVTLRIFLRPRFGDDIVDKIGRVWTFTMTFCTSDVYKTTSKREFK